MLTRKIALVLSFRAVLLLLLFFVLCEASQNVDCFSQDEKSSKKNASQPVDEEFLALKKQLKSPRATIKTFLIAMNDERIDDAINCIDVSHLDDETRSAKGYTLAFKLHRVIQHPLVWDQNLDSITDDSEYEPPYTLGDTGPAKLIQLFPSSDGLWKFSRMTIDAVDQAIYEELYDSKGGFDSDLPISMRIGSLFPAPMRDTWFLIQNYKWICLAILLIAGFLVARVVKYLLDFATSLWFRFSGANVDDSPRLHLWDSIGTLAHVGTWYLGARLIDLPSNVISVLLQGFKFLTVVAAVWTAFRAINLLGNYLEKRAAKTASRFDDSLVPLICNALKVVSVVMGLVFFVDVFQLDWKAVLGGFGVGGIAIAIAAKDVISNFFGSVTVLIDRPFEVGDWVVIDKSVEGTVESVGMRSSRIRTFHNSQIIVPNSLLTTAVVDNMGRRRARRFKTHLQVKYDTPVEKLEVFCSGIRQLISTNRYTQENFHVYVNQFSESSIDILIYLFFACSDWSAELRERHCLLTDVLKLAEELEIGFAFPTRTIEMETKSVDDSATDPKRYEGNLSELAKAGRAAADKILGQRQG